MMEGEYMNIPAALKPEKRDWLPMMTLAFAIFLQTATAIWFASEMNSRVSALEAYRTETGVQITTLGGQVDILRDAQAQTAGYMGRIEERLVAQAAALARVERLLEGRP